jgi:methionyl-tRNA formyltransferase
MRILFIGKDREDIYFEQAKAFIVQNFPELEILLAAPGSRLPDAYTDWKGDYLISYLCPWVIPAKLINNLSKGAINFHPGPPQYPGSGCTNFAIYHEVAEYGVTCHYMSEKVDSGKIIAVRRFPVSAEDSVYAVTQRCYEHMLALFLEILSMIKDGRPLPDAGEQWSRNAYRLKDFHALRKITSDMDETEIRRRIRAAAYPGYEGAYIETAGAKFVFQEYVSHEKEGQ